MQNNFQYLKIAFISKSRHSQNIFRRINIYIIYVMKKSTTKNSLKIPWKLKKKTLDTTTENSTTIRVRPSSSGLSSWQAGTRGWREEGYPWRRAPAPSPELLRRGRSELVLERLAQLLGGFGHILALPVDVHVRARRVLHRRVGPPHGIAAAELGPRNPHALNVAQPRLHDDDFPAECLTETAPNDRDL